MTDADKITPDQIIELAGKCTPLPWEAYGPEHDAAYIVAACNSAPALARDAKALERVRDILGPKLESLLANTDEPYGEPTIQLTPAEARELKTLLEDA